MIWKVLILIKFLRKLNAFFEKDVKIALTYKFNLLLQFIWFSFISIIIFYTFMEPNNIDSNINYFHVFVSLASIDFMLSSLNVFSREVRIAQTTGTFEGVLITNTSPLTIILSSYARTFFRSIIRAMVYFLVCKFFFFDSLSLYNVFFLLITLVYFSIPFLALGLISASFIIVFKVGDVTNFIISIFSIFFSGIFFSTESLPSIYQNLGIINPINAYIQFSKFLLQDSFIFENYIAYFKIMFLEIIILFPLGVFLINYAFYVSKKSGSLSQY